MFGNDLFIKSRRVINMETNEYLDQAIKLGQKALELAPNNYHAYLALGGAYLKKGKYDSGFEFLEKALALKPSHADLEKIYLYMGEIFFAKDLIDRSISYFEKVTEHKIELPAAYFIMATCYIKKGDYGKALTLYQKIMTINGQYKNVYSALGSVHILMKSYKEAISAFEKNIEINGKNSHDFYALGACYLALDLYDEAINYFEEALRVTNKSNDWLHLALGAAYHSRDYLYPALDCYIQALSKDDNKKLQCYSRAGDMLIINICKQVIEKEIKKRCEFRSDSIIPHYMLSIAYKHHGAYDKAIEACQKILESEPSDGLALFLLGDLYTAQKSSPQTAIDAYKKVFEQDNQDIETAMRLVNLYLEQQQYDLALVYGQKALEINPNDPVANLQAGLIHWKKGLPYTAQPLLEKAVELNPNNAEACFHLGEIYLALKNHDSARQAWEKTVELAPDSQLGMEAKKKLSEMDNI